MANGDATWKPSSFLGAGPLWAPALGAAAFWPGDLSGAAVAGANAPRASAKAKPTARHALCKKDRGDASTLIGLLPIPSRFNTDPARRLPRIFRKWSVVCFGAGVRGFRARALGAPRNDRLVKLQYSPRPPANAALPS